MGFQFQRYRVPVMVSDYPDPGCTFHLLCGKQGFHGDTGAARKLSRCSRSFGPGHKLNLNFPSEHLFHSKLSISVYRKL